MEGLHAERQVKDVLNAVLRGVVLQPHGIHCLAEDVESVELFGEPDISEKNG